MNSSSDMSLLKLLVRHVASNYLHQTDRFCIVVGKRVDMVVVAGHLHIKSRDVVILFFFLFFDHLTGKAGS